MIRIDTNHNKSHLVSRHLLQLWVVDVAVLEVEPQNAVSDLDPVMLFVIRIKRHNSLLYEGLILANLVSFHFWECWGYNICFQFI